MKWHRADLAITSTRAVCDTAQDWTLSSEITTLDTQRTVLVPSSQLGRHEQRLCCEDAGAGTCMHLGVGGSVLRFG